MEKQLDEILPVWEADVDGILSVTGGRYTIGFEVIETGDLYAGGGGL